MSTMTSSGVKYVKPGRMHSSTAMQLEAPVLTPAGSSSIPLRAAKAAEAHTQIITLNLGCQEAGRHSKQQNPPPQNQLRLDCIGSLHHISCMYRVRLLAAFCYLPCPTSGSCPPLLLPAPQAPAILRTLLTVAASARLQPAARAAAPCLTVLHGLWLVRQLSVVVKSAPTSSSHHHT
jgi:hypothetical protein